MSPSHSRVILCPHQLGVFTGWIGWFAVSWASPWVARWGHSQDVQLRNLLHGLLVSEIKSELIQPDFCD